MPQEEKKEKKRKKTYFVATKADVARDRVVVVGAKRVSLVLEAGFFEERPVAGLAVEAVRVVLVPEGVDIRADDDLVAAVALGPKELHKVLVAVREALPLNKGLALEPGIAVGAAKVLRVPHLSTPLDVVPRYGLAAGAAHWEEDLLVVLPAVELAVHHVEGLVQQVQVAVHAVKVLLVPVHALHLQDRLGHDLLITKRAHREQPGVGVRRLPLVHVRLQLRGFHSLRPGAGDRAFCWPRNRRLWLGRSLNWGRGLFPLRGLSVRGLPAGTNAGRGGLDRARGAGRLLGGAAASGGGSIKGAPVGPGVRVCGEQVGDAVGQTLGGREGGAQAAARARAGGLGRRRGLLQAGA